MADTASPVESLHFERARDFLEALRLSYAKWTPVESIESSWVFRGQSNSRWGLKASAFRIRGQRILRSMQGAFDAAPDWAIEESSRPVLDYLGAVSEGTWVEVVDQVHAEWTCVWRFLQLADALGHLVPDDQGEPPFGGTGLSILRSAQRCELDVASRAFALAQHHGVPTRLLDWTRDPAVAAFFACDGVDPKQYGSSRHVAVWAVDTRKLRLHDRPSFSDGATSRFVLYEPRRAGLDFLRLQKGCFTFDSAATEHYCRFGNWPAMSDVVRGQGSGGEAMLSKLTLPYSQIPHLLGLLANEGVSRAHLMPTLDNIVTSMVAKGSSDRVVLGPTLAALERFGAIPKRRGPG